MQSFKPVKSLGRKSLKFLITPLVFTGIASGNPTGQTASHTSVEPPAHELSFSPNGVNPSPDWGIEKVGEQQNDGTAYTYPDTTNPVRLYLIDTAVTDPTGWMAENTNLDFEETIVIGGNGDPTTSSNFGHGTRMLSIIAGLDTGIAPGTPIKVINYDVYPTPTTNASKLAVAIYDAVGHYQDSAETIPSVICLASSSDMLGSSFALQSAIEFAVEQGITVVVSAGNSGADAASYIPAAYGDIEGVICVGASNSSDNRISSSNFGADLDILAPGDMILAKNELGGDIFMQGTSPATAMVAGSALAELSMNGSLTPAEVESALVSAAIASPTGGAPPVLRSTPLAAANIALPDGPITDSTTTVALSVGQFPTSADNSTNPTDESDSDLNSETLGVLHGSNTEESIAVAKVSPQEFALTFPVDLLLIDDQDPFALKNGYTWRIRCANDLTSWSVPQGKLSKSTAPDGTVSLTATIPATADSCFFRIEVAPPVGP